MEERFTYDLLDRLTGVVEGLDTTGVFAYDAYGRMTSKYLHGAMVFDETVYNADGRPHAVKLARMYSPQPDMSMGYTSFDKLRNVRTGNLSLTYGYGYEHQRLRMVETLGNDTVKTKEYVGSCEFVTEDNGTVVTKYSLTYLSGPLGVFAVRDTRMLPESKRMYYVHPDHLGSWTTVTAWNGRVVQDVWFDPWGIAYNIPPGSEPSPAASLLFDRGFTGHEHLMEFGLINMNGRMYDPVMSCFLSVDNYVQDPSCTQNFNRYAYCMNNPLKYTDPDGEWIQFLVGGLLGAWNGYSIAKAAGLKGWDMAWSIIGGAAVGVATAGIGALVSEGFSNVAVGTILGGATSGAVSGSAFGTAAAYANGAREEDLVNAFFKGFSGGLIGGAAGSACGGLIGGGWGALAGGFTSSSVATAFQYDNFRDIKWGNVFLNGICGAAMGLSVYHVATAYSYYNSGLKSTLKYKQYSKLIRITQRSMMTNREAKFVAYSDGRSISRLGAAHNVNSEGVSYENAIFDYHTHTSLGNTLADGEGFSTFKSAIDACGDGTKSDEYARSVLNRIGYNKPMYLGTREGHFWYMNSDATGTRGMINGFDHSFVFYYYQNLFMLYNF